MSDVMMSDVFYFSHILFSVTCISKNLLTTHDSRLTTHDSRLTTHDSRLTTHDSRLTTHVDHSVLNDFTGFPNAALIA